MLEPIDYMQIQNMINLYPYLIDDPKNYGRVGEIFTEDVSFSAGPLGTYRGLAALIDYWSHSPTRKQVLEQRPLWGHNVVNLVITEDGDGTVRCRSRCIGVYKDGGASMIVYDDVLRRTPKGWRIAERRLTPLDGPTVS